VPPNLSNLSCSLPQQTKPTNQPQNQNKKHSSPPSSSPPSPTAASAYAAESSRGPSLEALESARGACNLVSRYTPAYVRSRALRTPQDALAVAARVAQILLELGTYGASLALDAALPSALGGGDSPERVRLRARQLREALTRLGPSFIKAGQVLASRPDIVREDYMNELCVLQDDVPPYDDAVAFATVERELGRPVSSVFSSISERPVAAASLAQVYKAVLRETGEAVAVKVQRPGIEPVILRDLIIFRALAALVSPLSRARLGCDAELLVDEFGEKLLEELDYRQEARNIEEFGRNFAGDGTVKIPWVRRDLSAGQVVTMEWIEGIRCTDPAAIAACPGLSVDAFIRTGVVSGLRQLLEFGLFHGDPHPGNIFAMPDGRIAYVDFGNVAQLGSRSKATLVDAVVHAVNEDYTGMAGDFVALGFLSPGTDIRPIVPALEKIWRDSRGQSLAEFNFRSGEWHRSWRVLRGVVAWRVLVFIVGSAFSFVCFAGERARQRCRRAATTTTKGTTNELKTHPPPPRTKQTNNNNKNSHLALQRARVPVPHPHP